jgi:hypothetical protein|tara:strand:- start:53866 stop:54402 length:537 start_codon:yes stop_codon:yes gene_type:complete
MKTIQKTSIGFAIGMLTSLASGVGSASTTVVDLNTSRTTVVQQCYSAAKTRRYTAFYESVRRSAHRAHRLAQLYEADAYRLSQLESGVIIDSEPYTGMVHSLREVENQIKEILQDVDPAFAKEAGLLELRRNLALARSNAVTAERMAWQTSAVPEISEGKTSGEALAAAAEYITNRIV